jgi:hypothetical protein
MKKLLTPLLLVAGVGVVLWLLLKRGGSDLATGNATTTTRTTTTNTPVNGMAGVGQPAPAADAPAAEPERYAGYLVSDLNAAYEPTYEQKLTAYVGKYGKEPGNALLAKWKQNWLKFWSKDHPVDIGTANAPETPVPLPPPAPVEVPVNGLDGVGVTRLARGESAPASAPVEITGRNAGR